MAARTLREEIGRRRPFESAAEEAVLNLMRTHAAVTAPVARLFREHGLSESGYNVLRIVRGAGRAGRTCSGISGDMVVRVPDVTRLVDRLESMGLVTRARGEEDRRVVVVRLTSKGARLLAKLDGPVIGVHEATLGHMTKGELKELSRLLEKARHGAAASGAEEGA